MNKIITSREAILKTAKGIAYRDGIYKLSIRGLAAECGISIGSVYNYFPKKSDLVNSVIEDFWLGIFEKGMCNHNENSLCFIEFYEEIYMRFFDCLKIFKDDMVNKKSFLSDGVIENEQSKQAKYLERIKMIMKYHLELDINIKENIWHKSFTKEKFVEFAFENMFLMLKSNESDISFFKETLKKLLY